MLSEKMLLEAVCVGGGQEECRLAVMIRVIFTEKIRNSKY